MQEDTCLLCANMEYVRLLPFEWHVGEKVRGGTERAQAGRLHGHAGCAWRLEPREAIPNILAELAAIVVSYQQTGISPNEWVMKKVPLWVDISIRLRARKQHVAARFIRKIRLALSAIGDTQHSCLLCGHSLPARWMVILCQSCHLIKGGGARDRPTQAGREVIRFLR